MNEIKSLNPSQIVHNQYNFQKYKNNFKLNNFKLNNFKISGCGKMMLNVILKEIDMYYLNRPCTKKWDIRFNLIIFFFIY